MDRDHWADCSSVMSYDGWSDLLSHEITGGGGWGDTEGERGGEERIKAGWSCKAERADEGMGGNINQVKVKWRSGGLLTTRLYIQEAWSKT